MADLIDDNFVAGGGAPSAAAEKRKRKREKDKQKRDKKRMKMSPPEVKKDWDSKSLSELLSKFISSSLDDKAVTVDSSRVKSTSGKEALFTPQPNNLPFHLAELFGDKFSKLTTKSEADKPGHPKVIVVCSSALRAVALHKTCCEMHKRVLVGKMFAKHIKVKEQEDFLKSKVSHVLIGTPNRLATLTNNKALHLDQLEYLVFDSWKNAKGFSLLEVREVGKDLASFLDGHFLETEINFSFL